MICSVEAHPATKEQRDLLFQKMKEAGYEWDGEKKELKKIEQKPIDSDWVDLGLPSGTLWKSSNETDPNDDKHDFYTYDEAMQKFGYQLPAKEQWEELRDNCRWTWTGKGYSVIGSNCKCIFLPAAGYRYNDYNGHEHCAVEEGSYWVFTPYNLEYTLELSFNSWKVLVDVCPHQCNGQSVRLVK